MIQCQVGFSGLRGKPDPPLLSKAYITSVLIWISVGKFVKAGRTSFAYLILIKHSFLSLMTAQIKSKSLLILNT